MRGNYGFLSFSAPSSIMQLLELVFCCICTLVVVHYKSESAITFSEECGTQFVAVENNFYYTVMKIDGTQVQRSEVSKLLLMQICVLMIAAAW